MGYRMIHVMRSTRRPVGKPGKFNDSGEAKGSLLRARSKKRRSQAPRPIREALSGPNERWSMDFVSGTLSNGRRFRCLTIMDEFSRDVYGDMWRIRFRPPE